MSVAILIPAKVHSSRLPGKNWKEFVDGKSLTELAIERSIKSKIGDVYLSTDAGENLIDNILYLHPFTIIKRPMVLTMEERLSGTIEHFIRERPGYDHVFMTLPTSPILDEDWMKTIWDDFAFNANNNETLISVVKKTISVPMSLGENNILYPTMPDSIIDEEPYLWKFVNESYRPQEYYTSCGAAWICDCLRFMDQKKKSQYIHPMRAFVLNADVGVDINTEHDFILAREIYLKRQRRMYASSSDKSSC